MKKWLISVLVIWTLLGVVHVYLKDWQQLTAIATWTLALGVFLAILQIIEARKSTNAQIAIELFGELRNYETVEKLRSIYDLKPEDLKTLSSDKKKEIDYVLGGLDVLGALVNNGIIDEKLAIETYGGFSALRCWYKLCEDYIRVEQRNRGYYYENYETFVRLALDYFKKAKMPIRLDEVDLVEELQKDELNPRSLKQIKRDRKLKQQGKV